MELAGFDEVAGITVSPMPPRRRSPDDRLTSGEVAELLRISRSTVHRIDRSKLRYWETDGGHRRYLLAHVAEYAQSQGIDLARPDGPPEEETPDA
jgi:excisionase family DNA binding protein